MTWWLASSNGAPLLPPSVTPLDQRTAQKLPSVLVSLPKLIRL